MRDINPMHIYSDAECNVILNDIFTRASLATIHASIMFRNIQEFLAAVKEIGALYRMAEEPLTQACFDRIIIDWGFVSTMKPHIVNRDGSITMKPEGSAGPIREYFDGSKVRRLGHAAAVCVDLGKKALYAQDPWGRPFDGQAGHILRKGFPGYVFTDLQIPQQRDYHSCMVITLDNIERFANGEMPVPHVDVMDIRARHAGVIKEFERRHSPTGADAACPPLNIAVPRCRFYRIPEPAP